MTSIRIQDKIQDLLFQYQAIKIGKESLLQMIQEVEISEQIYNSNAIENSTLTLKETEKILMEMEVERNISVREVYEAKNLSRVLTYIQKNPTLELNLENIKLLHQMLITNINDDIAGRFRQSGEYVRVGKHIAPAPQHITSLIQSGIDTYKQSITEFITDTVAKFHLNFEYTHPFLDGNGRIGRVLLNWQLTSHNIPPIIIRNKHKKHYYQALQTYDDEKNTQPLANIIALAIFESLHKRITYLAGKRIITLSEYSKHSKRSIHTLLNSARRQTIPAFREREVWKIGV